MRQSIESVSFRFSVEETEGWAARRPLATPHCLRYPALSGEGWARSQEMNQIFEAFALLVRTAKELYLGKREEPLHWAWRLTCASVGAGVFLFWLAWFVLIPRIERENPEILFVEFRWIMATLTLLLSVALGAIIGASGEKAGPVRLFLSGVFLPAFTFTFIRTVLEIEQ